MIGLKTPDDAAIGLHPCEWCGLEKWVLTYEITTLGIVVLMTVCEGCDNG